MSTVMDQVVEVAGSPGYRVTSDGRVQSAWKFGAGGLGKDWHDLTLRRDVKGYMSCQVLISGVGRRTARVHRLVAKAFLPNPDELPCVRHLNGDPADNRVENLAWGTYAQNEQDKRRHGTYELRRNGKLTASDRALARELHQSGMSQVVIASRLNVSRPTITRLLNGSTWGPL